MKSQPLGVSSSCDNCSFAIRNNKKQIGCKAGRLEKFFELNVVQTKMPWDDSYKINRFCNMFRTGNEEVEEVKKQIALTFGIVIYDDSEEFLNSAIKCCKAINYDKSKFKIIVVSKNNHRFGRLFGTIQEFKSLGINAELLFIVDKDEEQHVSEKHAFQKVYNYNYLIKMKTGDSFNPQFLNFVNESINENLDRVIVYETNGINCVQFYTLNNNYLTFNDYDKTVEFIKEQSIKGSMYKKYEE